jgi:hypothetical protein
MLQRSMKFEAARHGFPLSLSTLEIHHDFTAEQFTAAQKANLETLFGLTNKAFEGVEKLVELNLQVAKATLAEVAENAKAACR